MARVCTLAGAVLLVLGVALTAVCVAQIARDADYGKAALVAARNPGNVLYEAEFKGAQVRRAFQIVGGFGGILLSLNGVTLVLLGVVAARGSRAANRNRSPSPTQSC